MAAVIKKHKHTSDILYSEIKPITFCNLKLNIPVSEKFILSSENILFQHSVLA